MIVPVTGLPLIDLAISATIAGGFWTIGSWIVSSVLTPRRTAP